MRWVGTVTMATAYALRSRALRQCRNWSREWEESATPPSSNQKGEPRDWSPILRTVLYNEKNVHVESGRVINFTCFGITSSTEKCPS